MRRLLARLRPLAVIVPLVGVSLSLGLAACEPKNAIDAESRKDIAWLSSNPTGESVAALGRLADTDPRAVAALTARADADVNVHIAAWVAITRNAAWGTKFMKESLADPMRAEMAASALPRKDARLVPFIPDLEGAIARLASGKRGTVIAGILASIGPPAHAAVEKRLLDPKTRQAMCDAIALPEASGDAKSVLLAVPPEGRDSPSCVNAVIDMAATENVVLDWIATGAEPGLLGVAANSSLPCARLAELWKKALTARPAESHAALTVPLQRSISRCGTQLDPVLADLLAKAPQARASIVQAIDPFASELASMKETCAALRAGHVNGESAGVRARASEAVRRGCAFAR